MMRVDAFARSLSAAAPPERANLALQALWWAGKGEWERAHRCAQQGEGDPGSDLVHAHLHRQEGDTANAATGTGESGNPFRPWVFPRSGTPSPRSCSHRASAKRMYSRERGQAARCLSAVV